MATIGIGIEIAILLFTAFVAYFISVRIGLTVIITEILLGIFLGFFGFVSYSESVRLIGELGAIFLLFVVGLEVDFRKIYTLKNSFIAFLGVLIPFFSGFLITKSFGYSSVQAMFIGTALTATSIAITAYVLRELNYFHTPAANAIIGAAVVDDILALLMLSITSGISSSDFSVFSIVLKVLVAIIFVVISVLLIPFLRLFLNEADKWGRKAGIENSILILAMAIAFAYSSISELIGLSAIVGAFLAGVSLHGLKNQQMRIGAGYLEMVFAAIFFVSIGVLLDIKQISLNLFFVFILVAAILSKIVGCMFAAMVWKMKLKESFIVGVGMVPRGEIALVVGLIGLTSGIIDQTLYGVIIAMTLVTTILSPAALSLLIKKQPKL